MNKKILNIILLSAVLGLILVPQVMVFAQAPGAGAGAGAGGPAGWFGKAEDAFVKIGASIVVIGWIIAGILWLVSAGSPEKTGTAKKAIVACVIGTILIIIASGAMEFIKTTFGIQ